jgi:hypothetical protein
VIFTFCGLDSYWDSLSALVVRVPGSDIEVPGSIHGATRCSEKRWGLEGGPFSLVRITEELLK